MGGVGGGGEGDFTLTLIDCVNIRKRSEAANQPFFLLNCVKYSFSLWASLKVTNEKKWRIQNFDFKSLKSPSQGQLLGSSYSRRYHWIFKLLVSTRKTGSKTVCVAFLLFSFWKELWRFKVKESILFVEQKFKVNKNETESKRENVTYRFREMDQALSACIRTAN